MSQINESALATPGVYVNELNSFPPSVAQVATAVPVFIGYTQTALKAGKDVTNQAVRVSSLVQYIQYFGGDFPSLTANVVLKNDNSVDSVSISPKYQLFNAIRMYYNNGGLNCYIISVGPYKSNGTADILDFINAGQVRCLEVLRKEDEPTLIVVPDAILLDVNNFNNLMQASLKLCSDLQDRFTILDVLNGDQQRTFDSSDVITVFRNGIGTNNLNYGAAYYPWLRSSLPYTFSYQHIQLQKPAGTNVNTNTVITNNDSVTQIDAAISDLNTFINPFINTPGFAAPFNVPPLDGPITVAYKLIPSTSDKPEVSERLEYIKDILVKFISLNGSFTDKDPGNIYPGLTTQEIHSNYIKVGIAVTFISPIEQLMREAILIDSSFPNGGAVGAVAAGDFGGYNNLGSVVADPTIYGTGVLTDAQAAQNIRSRVENLYNNSVNMVLAFLNEIQNRINSLELQIIASNAVYANISLAIKNEGIVVPPSGAVAGIYAAVDGTRGVWKAPANVSVTTVIEPMVNIDDNEQGDLNIDTNAGKSINAIRAFTGKGVLVWGARTLEGNSQDWRYVSVRRFYIMVEESVKKATMQFVFEPNDANTWVKVRAMIENYLTNLWRDGALAGPKPEVAFYVKVGLGQTMTAQDVLDGRLIVEIGMAPVRPAEFIILRFTQIQQQA